MHIFSRSNFFAIFLVANFLHMSQKLRVPVPELGIDSSKPYRRFKSSLLSLMIINNGENKIFRMCKSISSKGSRAKQSKTKGHNFTGAYPRPVLMNLGAKTESYCHVCLSTL